MQTKRNHLLLTERAKAKKNIKSSKRKIKFWRYQNLTPGKKHPIFRTMVIKRLKNKKKYKGKLLFRIQEKWTNKDSIQSKLLNFSWIPLVSKTFPLFFSVMLCYVIKWVSLKSISIPIDISLYIRKKPTKKKVEKRKMWKNTVESFLLGTIFGKEDFLDVSGEQALERVTMDKYFYLDRNYIFYVGNLWNYAFLCYFFSPFLPLFYFWWKIVRSTGEIKYVKNILWMGNCYICPNTKNPSRMDCWVYGSFVGIHVDY